jgi:phage baseplate assembly protein W|tara:strand:- start:52 stop:561 length:510 start_codon:yes stop_codon:yes gene_type:complete
MSIYLSDRSSQPNIPVEDANGRGPVFPSSNIVGDTRRASTSAKSRAWTDIDLSLILHPIRQDIVPLKDDNAIRYAVRNLLLTNFYERPFNLGVGANLRALLFEPADGITKSAIKENIQRCLTEHERRVELIFINIVDEADTNSYRILVKFRIKEYDAEKEVEIVLRRLR